jgi:RND family efflux transporter MFP subunit
VAAAAAAGVLLVACKGPEKPAVELMPVRTVIAGNSAGAGGSGYTAEIRSAYEVDLGFQVGGRVAARFVDVGTRVHRGMPLAQLDQTDQRLALSAAAAALDAARAEYDRAAVEEARYRELLERGLTTRAAYLNQQTSVATSRSRVEQATSDLRLSQQRLAYTTLRSESDGVVTQLTMEVGAVVSPGERVASVAQPSRLEAVFDVPDSDLGRIAIGTLASLQLFGTPAVVVPVRVSEIAPAADSVTRTYRIRATIDAPPPNLMLGMNALVQLPGEGSGSLSLPATALFQRGRDAAVWVVDAQQRLQLRPVTVGRYESNTVLITAGIRNGERIVTAGVHRLADHQAVRLIGEIAP